MAQIKWIKPKPIPLQNADRAIRFALQRGATIVRADYHLFTGTWEPENEPKWRDVGPRKVGKDLAWEYSTTSTPFMYVEEGTRPHLISARVALVLAFQTGFIAKTKPRQVSSGPGAHFGPMAHAKQVMHPGNEPRHVSQEIAKNILPFLLKFMLEAMRW